MFRRKCAKVVFRAQWLVTVGSSWEVVGDSSLVQCKTRFVQIFHIFFFMKQIFVDPPLSSYPDLALSYAVGDSGTRLPLPLLTHTLNCLRIPFVLLQWELHCSCLKPLVLVKCCSGWELICFHSRLEQFPEESGVDEQNSVVLRVIVSDPHHIWHLSSPPSKH